MGAAALMASCSKGDESVSPSLHGDPLTRGGEIVFTAEGEGFSSSVMTKAAAAVTSLSSFNVNCVTGTAGSAETSVFNVAFSGSPSFSGGKYWPSADPKYKFYASNVAMTPSAVGPTIAAVNTTDIVCAALLSPTYKASNALTFSHIFARLGTCKISAPSGYTVSNLSVKVTPNVSGTYNLFSGNGKTDGTGWSSKTPGSETVIASAVGSTASNDLYLVPGTYTLTASYTLTMGAYSESFTKSSTVSLMAGKVNNISATLPAGNAAGIQFTVSVTPWSDNNITASFN